LGLNLFGVVGASFRARRERRREEEKKGFELLVDEIMRRKEKNQRINVYDFGA
jgi:hypothetical protein